MAARGSLLGVVGLLGVVSVLLLAARAGWVADDSPLAGLDYLPPLILALIAVPVAVMLNVLGCRITAALTTAGAFVVLVSLGDVSLIRKSRAAPVVEPFTDDIPRLRVLALNVRYYSHGVERVAAYIQSRQPDVALLSENTLSDSEREAFENRLKGYRFLMGRHESTALCSRLQVVSWKEVELPSLQVSLTKGNTIDAIGQRGVHRAFTHAVVDFHGTHINVISVRFVAGRARTKSLGERYRWGRYLLEMQRREVAFFRDYLSTLSGPFVFGGDLNATPSSAPVRQLRAVAADAYLERHLLGGFTFRTKLPTMRLDYVFHSPELVTRECRVLRDIVSDHFPVWAEFSLAPRRQLSGSAWER